MTREIAWAIRKGNEGEVARLVDADPTLLDAEFPSCGMRPLWEAAKHGQVGVLQLLIQRGADASPRPAYERTLLHWAALGDSEEMVTFLLSSGIEVDATDRWGMTAATLACKEGSLRVVQLLLEHMGPQGLEDESGKMAVHQAAEGGRAEIMAFLLGRGEAAGTRGDECHMTPLMLASLHGHEEVVQMLHHHLGGQGLEDVNDDGMTALHLAAHIGHHEVVAFLCSVGAQANTRDVRGRTPLMEACELAHGPVFLHLIDHLGERGLDERDREGMTALHYAAAGGDGMKEYVSMVLMLLFQGADPNIRDNRGRTPRDVAEEEQNQGPTIVLTVGRDTTGSMQWNDATLKTVPPSEFTDDSL